ncbi:MAG: T9SS type A sorting domain-containing protein [Bacteroidales bacterium]|nr:T9SS type A sorting domain-containing protein [Bacteroidales bacterium]
MKKATLTLIVSITIILQSFGQLNPINNLNWEHWYVCPNNYFNLNWEPPNISQDTLMGYNVYRNNELYRFQTETILNHEEYGGNCGEDFVIYNFGDFWIHVTAVYNSTYLESNYNDSAHCGGFLIGIDEMKLYQLNLFPNPATNILTIKSDNKTIDEIQVYNFTGQCVLEQRPSNNVFDVSGLKSGMYIIECVIDNKIIRQKLLVQR